LRLALTDVNSYRWRPDGFDQISRRVERLL
jgi:hypothetical protein